MNALRGLGAALLSLLIAADPVLAADFVKPVDIKVEIAPLGAGLSKPLEIQTGLGQLPVQTGVPELPSVPSVPGEDALVPAAAPLQGAAIPASLDSPGSGVSPRDQLQQFSGAQGGAQDLRPQQVFDGRHEFAPMGDSDDRSALGWDEMPAVPAEAPSSIAEISLEVPADARYTPSPDNWSQEIVYSVMFDRFARAEPHHSWGDPSSATSRHGGNIRGLIEKLDYIKGMGATTLLINPLYMAPPAAYHNYWPLHFMAVDPNLGTMADVKELIAEAHKRGMRIVLDMVFNHTGPVIEYEDGWKFSEKPKKIKSWKYPIRPVELMDENNFHRRGSIDDWDNPEEVKYGDFPGGLNHLATERPETQDILLKIAKWWMKETDIDGMRLDTYKHVAPAFWSRFFPEIRAYAQKLGKQNFLLLGEIYDGDPKGVAPELGHGRLGAAFDYPGYFADKDALHGKAPAGDLEKSFNRIREVLGDESSKLVRFLDNQDKPRFLGALEPLAVLKVAAAYIMFTIGIPYFYYGTEQAFRRVEPAPKLGLDGYREDMFAGGRFKTPSSEGDNFLPSVMYEHIRELARIRKSFPALSLGAQFIRWADPLGAGIFAFSRVHEGNEVVVVLNTASEPRSADMWVDAGVSPPGTTFVDEMNPAVEEVARARDGGSKIFVTVPAHGIRVFTRRSSAGPTGQ